MRLSGRQTESFFLIIKKEISLVKFFTFLDDFRVDFVIVVNISIYFVGILDYWIPDGFTGNSSSTVDLNLECPSTTA